MSPTRLLVVLALVASACTRPAPLSTTGTAPATTAPSTTASSQPTTTVEPTTTSTIVLAPPPGTEDLPASLQDQIVELLAATQDTRELPFLALPKVAVVTDEELAARVRGQIIEELDNAERDQALLVLLGLLPPGTDLVDLYTDLYGEQVAGYYDGDEGELVVPAGGDRLTPLQAVTMVHELTHALTDQHYQFNGELNGLVDEQRFDQASALQALVEGDAEFTSFQYLLALPQAERLKVVEEALAVQTDVFDTVPLYLRELLIFPYVTGVEFVDSLHRRGGFARVGEAYGAPPVSTEQVYAPRSYQDEPPLPVALPGFELPGYEVVEESTWGQLLFTVMFHQLVPGEVGDQAATGWGGDAYRLYWNGEEVAMVLAYQGDTTDDLGELEAVLQVYVSTGMTVEDGAELSGGAEYVGDDYAFVKRSDDRLVFIAASDPDAGGVLAAAFEKSIPRG